MKPLSKGTLEVLLEGKDRGEISAVCYERHRKAYIRFDTLVKRYGEPTWHPDVVPPKEAIIGDYDNVMFLIQNDIGNGCSGALGFHVVNRFGVCTFPKAFTPEDRDIPYVVGCHW
jgi:hypothetical protein